MQRDTCDVRTFLQQYREHLRTELQRDKLPLGSLSVHHIKSNGTTHREKSAHDVAPEPEPGDMTHSDAITGLYDLGASMAKQGDVDAADAAYAPVMEDFCRARGLEEMRQASTMGLYARGSAAREEGDTDRMEASYRKIVARSCQGRRLLDVVNDPAITGEMIIALRGATTSLAATFCQQGHDLHMQGEASKALIKLKEAFDMAQAGIALVEKTQRTRITAMGIQVAGNMALILTELGACGGTAGGAHSPKECIENGEKLARDVLVLAERLGGERHPLALCAAAYLSTVLERRRHYLEAAEVYSAVVRVRENRLGVDHAHVVTGKSKLENVRKLACGSWGLARFPPIVSVV